LFSYGEVPLTSLKLNRWEGNMAAAVNFLTEAVVTLFGGWSEDFVVPGLSTEPLKVVEQATPDMTVSVNAGRCIVSQYFAGIDEDETLPQTGSITAPASEDRIDVVAIGRDGSLQLVTGTEGTPPSPPATPADHLKLAEIYLRPTATVIKNLDDSTNGYIIDKRPSLLSGRAHRPSMDRTPAESPDGLRVNFSTSETFVTGTLRVFLNGLLQQEGALKDYTEDSDCHGYSFTSPPRIGDVIQHFYIAE
jgi:hypothetical protein